MLPVEPNKLSNAFMSENMISNQNIHHIMNVDKYSISNGVVRNEMTPRNSLNQPMKLGDRPYIRAVKKAREFMLGNRKVDDAKLESAAAIMSENGMM